MSPQLTQFLAAYPDAAERARLLADDPWWLVLIKAVVVLLIGPILTIFLIVWERKAIGRMQNRPGPNRVGPGGYLQSLADAVKLPFKEQIIPDSADRKVYFLAPVLSAVPALIALSAIPFGPVVSIFGHQTVLQLMDLPVGVLVILACSSVGVYGIVLAGWASGSPYPLFGGMRSAAQVISYEIAMGLSIVAVILYSGSLQTSAIVDAQAHGWYFYMLIPSFVIYLISMVGETNRAPFDLPEAESELVGGFHTEYNSMKFAMFFLAEYINMVIVSAFCTTLFLGGWRFPFVGDDSALNQNWWPVLWFFAKTFLLLFGFIWLRGTLPRLRYDQFMRLGWKVLVPVNLVWIVVVVAIKTIQWTVPQILIGAGVVLFVMILLSMAMPNKKLPESEYVELAGSGYPLPPLDLKVPDATPRQKALAKAEAKAARRATASVAAAAEPEGTEHGGK